MAAGGTKSTGPSCGSSRAESIGSFAAGTARVREVGVAMVTAVAARCDPLNLGTSAVASLTVTLSARAIVFS